MSTQTIESVQTVNVAAEVVESAPAKKIINFLPSRKTLFTAKADNNKLYPEHAVCVRRAPAGANKGAIFAEIACPTHLKAAEPLKRLDITPFDVEKITFGCGAQWKLYRFLITREEFIKLQDLCTVSDRAADETAFWLDNWEYVANTEVIHCWLPVKRG